MCSKNEAAQDTMPLANVKIVPMTTQLIALLTLGVFVVAILYSSVGHAGASGYIAVMSLMGLAPAVIKPTGLVLNILVASLASWQFIRGGHFSWRLLWPFALLAVPLAFVGGYVDLPVHWFKVIVGVVLLFSALRFVLNSPAQAANTHPSLPLALGAGAVIGFLSGLTGTGGGIFLTPLLLWRGWAQPKTAAAVSAFFILLNSTAGLLGNLSSTKSLPTYIVPLVGAAALGGLIGSYFGSRRFEPLTIKRLLAVVLTIAGAKLIFT